MSAKLVAEEGLLKELVLSFEDGEQWVIGRDPDACQLLVEDPAASRKHALSKRTAQGFIFENLSRTNPTQINDEELKEPHLLQEGDLVKIGDTLFRFYRETETSLNTSFPVVSEPHEELPEGAPGEDKGHDTILGGEGGDEGLAEINFDLMETGRWLLKVISGPNSGAEFSMQTGNNYIIGTDPNTCDIVFYDTSVSRQHARISVSPEDNLTIEDLKSRNGTRLEGKLLIEREPLPINTIVTLGTTSFVIYDREGEMQTIISPLLPSIVKVLQKEEPSATSAPETVAAESPIAEVASAPLEVPRESKTPYALGAFIMTGILIGLFVVVGIALQTLFIEKPVVKEQQVDVDQTLADTLKPFSNVKFSFNKTTGRILLVGHVLSATEKNQLLYNLQGLHFIRSVDDSGVIIDEYVWREANQTLAENPNWKGVSIHAPSAGQFVLSGYVQTRQQAEQIWDYLSRNFLYLDLLDNKMVVEEDLVNTINASLRDQGFNAVTAQISNGELTLNGSIPAGKKPVLEELLAKYQGLTGIRGVRNYVSESAHSEAIVDISDKYMVTGLSQLDGGKINAIVNGRIIAEGDVLDGMTITSISQNAIMLKKDNIIYRIEVRH